jgi:two-component system, OmpR family, sensor histidine kinase BaeS
MPKTTPITMRRTFRNRLMLSYLPFALLPALLIGLATRTTAEQGLNVLVRQDGRFHAEQLVPCLVNFYNRQLSWDGLATYLDALPVIEIVGEANSPQFGVFSQADVEISALATENAQQGPVLLRVGPGLLCLREMRFDAGLIEIAPAVVPIEPGLPFQPVQPLVLVPTAQPPPNSAGVYNPNPSAPGADGRPPGEGRRPRGGGRMDNIVLFHESALPEETLILDSAGLVLASVGMEATGQQVSPDVVAQSVPIFFARQVVARVVVGQSLGALNQQQQALLNTVSTGVLVAGIFSVGLGVGLGWFIAGQISGPIRTLKEGAKQLGAGQWSAPLPVRGKDEFSDLTLAFNRMASEITRQQQLNKQMIADIAHDLRTPLSAISLEVEAIEAGYQTPAEAATSLREEITWLQRLIDDLRTLSLLDADQIKLQPEPTAMQPFLASIYDFWLPMAEDEGRQLCAQLPPTLPTLDIDKGRLRQILGNLIDNAVRHTRPGDKITLSAYTEAGKLHICVADEGEGIPAEALPHLFDRFYRVSAARSHSDGLGKQEGSGLGLSIAMRFAEMHHGTITVQSKVGFGSTFMVQLPAL